MLLQASVSAPAAKVPRMVQPKGRIAALSGQKPMRRLASWNDAPDDVFYKATANTKRLRKRLSVQTLRRAARKPFKKTLTLPKH